MEAPQDAKDTIWHADFVRKLLSTKDTGTSVDDVVRHLLKARNIVVIAGAGISTSMGIPDFRTDGAGIYAMVGEKAAQYGLGDPQQVFDIELFKEDPEIFYKFANKILPKVEGVSLAHTFMRSLDQADKLLRIYTQNVDDLEIEAQIRGEKIVQMHGTMRNFRCMRCEYTISGAAHTQALRDSKVPYCPRVDCLREAQEAARPRKRRKGTREQPSRGRSVRDEHTDDPDEVLPAVLKPNIVFFGEPIPKEYYPTFERDLPVMDLVFVMGTSLSVKPASEMINQLPENIFKVWINYDETTIDKFNVQLCGPCDVVIKELCWRARVGIQHPKWEEFKEILVEQKKEHVHTFDWIIEGSESDPPESP